LALGFQAAIAAGAGVDRGDVEARLPPDDAEGAARVYDPGFHVERVHGSVRDRVPGKHGAVGLDVGEVGPYGAADVREQPSQIPASRAIRNDGLNGADDVGANEELCIGGIEPQRAAGGTTQGGEVAADVDRVPGHRHGTHVEAGLIEIAEVLGDGRRHGRQREERTEGQGSDARRNGTGSEVTTHGSSLDRAREEVVESSTYFNSPPQDTGANKAVRASEPQGSARTPSDDTQHRAVGRPRVEQRRDGGERGY
jgi:hypothetical protein